jgi:hypothetical protein
MNATANLIAGGPYQIKASVSSALSVTYALTNLAVIPHSTYTVGTVADHAGGLTSATTCRMAGNTTCALRDALAYATSGTDTITFNGTGQGTITLTNGSLTLTTNVTIIGPGANALAIDGGCTGCDPGGSPSGGVRVFVVNSGVTASISGLTIRHGNAGNGDSGGGIANNGTLTVTNSTISGNSSDNGGGLLNSGGTVTVTNTIVAGNSGGDITGAYTGSHNLIGGTPLLGTLGSYGGPTPTIPLLPGSPAIDAGDDATCAQTGSGKVNGLDQRGITRPQGAHCDIGAFEYQVVNPLPPAKPPGPAGGPPSPLPAVRPPGTTSGPAPNPLPVARP